MKLARDYEAPSGANTHLVWLGTVSGRETKNRFTAGAKMASAVRAIPLLFDFLWRDGVPLAAFSDLPS